MLNFTNIPAYETACKTLANNVAHFMRRVQKNQTAGDPPFLVAGTCIPFPDRVASDVYEGLKRMDLRRLNLPLLRLVMNDKMQRSDWDCAFAKLFKALIEMEQLGAGNSNVQ